MTQASWVDDARRLRSAAPRHVLFLCVANSARSQLAEGIARSLAPAGVRVDSAGSAPSVIRPQVGAVLSEIGIDTAGQFSKGLDAIDLDSVDAVITLCAEEVCPVFPRPVLKIHWGLPDPAGAQEAVRDDAFRAVRDELRRRLRVVFGESDGLAD